MSKQLRNKRVRLLVKKLNAERKNQAQKLDIICNDLITTQRDFISTVNLLAFTSNFYESIIGLADLKSVFYCAAKLIKHQLGELNITFFLPKDNNFEIYVFENEQPQPGQFNPSECFTPELVDAVCKSNEICNLNSLVSMGLEVNPSALKKISAATVPLGSFGVSEGFILMYRNSEIDFTTTQLNYLTSISTGFARAIQYIKARNSVKNSN